MLVKEFLFHSTCLVRNGNFLKIRVSEIRVKRIRVNQGLGVHSSDPISAIVSISSSSSSSVLSLLIPCHCDGT